MDHPPPERANPRPRYFRTAQQKGGLRSWRTTGGRAITALPVPPVGNPLVGGHGIGQQPTRAPSGARQALRPTPP